MLQMHKADEFKHRTTVHDGRDGCVETLPSKLHVHLPLQKRMERETGARIVIRGKGSVKEGRAGRKEGPAGGKADPGDNEELHVLVTADTEEQLERVSHSFGWCTTVTSLLYLTMVGWHAVCHQ